MQNKAGFWVFIFSSAAGLFHLQPDGSNDQEAIITSPSISSMHHIIISLPISGLPNQLGIMQPSRMLTLGQAPWCRVIAMDRRWSKHNSEYTMTSARRSEGLPNFHPFVSFLCICQKNKNIVKANFPWTYSVRIDHSRWRQESIIRSLNTEHSLSFGWK